MSFYFGCELIPCGGCDRVGRQQNGGWGMLKIEEETWFAKKDG